MMPTTKVGMVQKEGPGSPTGTFREEPRRPPASDAYGIPGFCRSREEGKRRRPQIRPQT